jgi:hypothetical protein
LYYRDNNPANDKAKMAGTQATVKECIDNIFNFMDELVEQGLYDFTMPSLNEAEEVVEKPFYAIVSGQVVVDGKKHRNIKSTVVTKAPDAITALKNIKKDLRSSVSSINKEIKKSNAKLDVEITDNIKIMSYDDVKKKNIENLVGSTLVSRGFVMLKGTMENGNISPDAEHAPMGYTFLNKSSVTRYLNKDR